MGGAVKVEWSKDALADLDRFARFLQQRDPVLAGIIANEIIRTVQRLSEYPRLGRPLTGHQEYRQVVMQIMNAAYVIQYRIDGERLVILRVFHGREMR